MSEFKPNTIERVYIYGLFHNDECIYVGSTKNFNQRKKHHISSAKHNSKALKLYRYLNEKEIDIVKDCKFVILEIFENTNKLDNFHFSMEFCNLERTYTQKYCPVCNIMNIPIPKRGYVYSLYYRKYDKCLFVGHTTDLESRILEHKTGEFKNDKLTNFLNRNNINWNDEICINVLMFDNNRKSYANKYFDTFLTNCEKQYIDELQPWYPLRGISS